MDQKSVDRGGAALWRCWEGRTLIDALPEASRPRTVDEGYAIQDALAASAGHAVAGYKIGATNAKVQATFGVDGPFSGRVFAPFVQPSPARIPRGAVQLHVIEAEFDFRMGAALPARDAPYDESEVRAAVDAVCPAIEVPDSRYADWLKMAAPDLIADNAIGGFLAVGAPAAGGLTHDLAGQAVTVRVNDRVVSEGSGAAVLGDPWNVMVWLANQLSQRGLGLEAGQVVTTGSAADVVKVSPGDTVTAEFGAIGSVTVHFEA